MWHSVCSLTKLEAELKEDFMLTKWIIGSLTVFALLTPACSSTPETAEGEAHRTYVSSAQDRLDKMEARAQDMGGTRREDLLAAVRDARISLNEVEDASETDWRSRRDRLERTLSNIRSNYELAE